MEPDASLDGERLDGRFVLERPLGGGGMGSVYQARDVSTGLYCAIKVLHPVLAQEGKYLARFEREARVSTRLAHPNIVEVRDVGYDATLQVPFLVMELLEGRTVGRLLVEEGALAPGRAVPLVRQVLAALAAVHSIGVVHRDLKPANVMVLAADVVKVVDFGVAHLLDTDGYTKLTRTGQIVGTPIFMSPEQAAGAAVDVRTDVWSTGALLYTCLAGSWPFFGMHIVEALPAILSGHIPPLESRTSVPSALARVVDRALSVDREERFASAEEMDEALARLDLGAAPRITSAWLPPASLEPLRRDARSGDTVLGKRQPAARSRDMRSERPPIVSRAPAAAASPRQETPGERPAPRSARPRRRTIVAVILCALLIGGATGWALAWRREAERASTTVVAPIAVAPSPFGEVQVERPSEAPPPTPIPVPELVQVPRASPDPDGRNASMHNTDDARANEAEPPNVPVETEGSWPRVDLHVSTPAYDYNEVDFRAVELVRDLRGFFECFQRIAVETPDPPYVVRVRFDVVEAHTEHARITRRANSFPALDGCVLRYLVPTRIVAIAPGAWIEVEYRFER